MAEKTNRLWVWTQGRQEKDDFLNYLPHHLVKPSYFINRDKGDYIWDDSSRSVR